MKSFGIGNMLLGSTTVLGVDVVCVCVELCVCACMYVCVVARVGQSHLNFHVMHHVKVHLTTL